MGRPLPEPRPAHTNRLATETSPYLLQHAHNPVDWRPWGPEALAVAREQDRPIFLSIGYAACHWCHVMERESFEDEATAAQLNASFVPIKVDREERPDLDAIYMDAVQQMTGSGGWPMSVFLTPDGRPFYGGTYFPDTPRHGMPAFRQVLSGVNEAWQERRDEVDEAATRLAAAVVAGQRTPVLRMETGTQVSEVPAQLDAAVAALESSFDARTGGWGGAPKFPQSMTIEFLLREHLRTGDPRPLAIARRSLDAMAAGGIHDQLGGGFHRYATDSVWLVPHFEKMLYDNAQLARVYLHAWQVTGDIGYREVALSTAAYLRREMVTADGGFAASQDADTDGEEGATYTWTSEEVRAVLGDAAAPLFEAAYGVSAEGDLEGRSILRRVRTDEELARAFGSEPAHVERRLSEARTGLLAARERRAQPGRDEKVLAAWNGLAIAALAEIAVATGSQEDRAAAIRAADAVLEGLRTADGRLQRSWKDGRATGEGVLEDHTHLADGLLALYESTFDERWFVAARGLMDTVLAHFADPDGGFYDTADDHERLVARPRSLQDNALPSGNAMAATVLLRLHALTGHAAYRDTAERALRPVVQAAIRYPTAFAQWLMALQLELGPIDELAIAGDPDGEDGAKALLDVARSAFRPWQVLAVAADPDASAIPLLHERVRLGGEPAAYVCRGFACQRPVTDPAALAAQLRPAPT